MYQTCMKHACQMDPLGVLCGPCTNMYETCMSDGPLGVLCGPCTDMYEICVSDGPLGVLFDPCTKNSNPLLQLLVN